MKNPLLSIIIPSYNSEKFIRECLDSARAEFDPRIEIILVDGASSDNTMAIVSDYSDILAKVISEPDRGQSDAFNKGFRVASGKFLTWLNSDDVICPGALGKVLSYLANTEVEWITANTLYINGEGRVLKCCRSGQFEGFVLNFGLLNVFGPSCFFTKKVFQEIGEFRVDFHYCMDTEYWWRLVERGYRYERVPCYFWALRLHEGAKTASAITGNVNQRPSRMKEEGALIRQRFYPTQTPFSKKIGAVIVRFYRVVTGSYIIAMRDTLKFRNLRWCDISKELLK